jgi:hypothetical protein
MILRLKPHFLAKTSPEKFSKISQAVNNNLSYLINTLIAKKSLSTGQVQIFDMYVPLVADYTLTVS